MWKGSNTFTYYLPFTIRFFPSLPPFCISGINFHKLSFEYLNITSLIFPICILQDKRTWIYMFIGSATITSLYIFFNERHVIRFLSRLAIGVINKPLHMKVSVSIICSIIWKNPSKKKNLQLTRYNRRTYPNYREAALL